MDRQKGVLDREIEGLLQSTNKKDNKSFQASFGFLNERFTLNEIEESEKNNLTMLYPTLLIFTSCPRSSKKSCLTLNSMDLQVALFSWLIAFPAYIGLNLTAS